jgi:hypothetical protein
MKEPPPAIKQKMRSELKNVTEGVGDDEEIKEPPLTVKKKTRSGSKDLTPTAKKKTLSRSKSVTAPKDEDDGPIRKSSRSRAKVKDDEVAPPPRKTSRKVLPKPKVVDAEDLFNDNIVPWRNTCPTSIPTSIDNKATSPPLHSKAEES